MKNLIKILVVVLLACLSPAYALAADNDCGKGFASSFLPSVMDFQDFSVYWADIFTKNMCQIDDIFQVEEDLDSIGESIRASYYSCDYENVKTLTIQYKMAKAELYFVRNAAFVDSGSLNSEDVKKINEQIDSYLSVDKGVLYKEMVEKYVTTKGWFQEDDFKIYFASWVSEYEDNILTYIDCNYGDWTEVADKWDELWSNFKKTEVKPPPQADANAESAGLSAKDAPAKDNKGFFAKHFEFLTPGVDEISKDINAALAPATDDSENLDTYYSNGGIVSTSENYADLLSQYDTEMTEAELLAKYATLYGEGGTEIAKSLTALITDLNTSLLNTVEVMTTNVNDISHKISNKQCGGTRIENRDLLKWDDVVNW